jgi:GNAT superfamily N-acetyltransferase
MARITARPATPADHPHFARLFLELGVDDPVVPADRWAETMAPATTIFEDGAGVVGYAYVQVLQGVGYVRHVVVDPDRRGAGLGRGIMAAVAAQLRAAGCPRWCLNVKPDNEPAVRLYRAMGMVPQYTATAFRFTWDLLDRLPRLDRVVESRIVESSEDAAIEAAFAMPAGQIADARKRPDLVLLRLVDPSLPADARIGFAAYDPRFPGAFPFRVAEPRLAAALLAAIRPHEPPDTPYMQIVSEDEALTEVLLTAGAQVRLVISHMAGAVPAQTL